jgi:hypothetical protein
MSIGEREKTGIGNLLARFGNQLFGGEKLLVPSLPSTPKFSGCKPAPRFRFCVRLGSEPDKRVNQRAPLPGMVESQAAGRAPGALTSVLRELSAGVCKEPAPTYFWEE